MHLITLTKDLLRGSSEAYNQLSPTGSETRQRQPNGGHLIPFFMLKLSLFLIQCSTECASAARLDSDRPPTIADSLKNERSRESSGITLNSHESFHSKTFSESQRDVSV